MFQADIVSIKTKMEQVKNL